MVSAIRNVEKSLGSEVKAPTNGELKNRIESRKSILARKIIKKGEIYSESNLIVKRPGDGLSPMLWDRMMGQIANRDYMPDEKID